MYTFQTWVYCIIFSTFSSHTINLSSDWKSFDNPTLQGRFRVFFSLIRCQTWVFSSIFIDNLLTTFQVSAFSIHHCHRSSIHSISIKKVIKNVYTLFSLSVSCSVVLPRTSTYSFSPLPFIFHTRSAFTGYGFSRHVYHHLIAQATWLVAVASLAMMEGFPSCIVPFVL